MVGDYQAARSTAHHEAGHAVVALTLGLEVQRIAIAPCCNKKYAGECTSVGTDDFPHIACCLAGLVAQRRFDVTASDGTAGDKAIIRQILRNRYGRCVAELDEPIVRAAQRKAEEIVEKRWPEIAALASELIKRFEIKGKEVRQIVAVAATKRIMAELERLEGSI
ncbi:MAG: M50 family metallopeptidase [Planctomycetes bacterium]|nr:M50 family metallopeptidase [Planctomycetota bacterium]